MKSIASPRAALALLLACTIPVLATNPDWHLGAASPAGWSITPSQPGAGTVINFVGPFFDSTTQTQPVYGNPCVAESMMGGKPKLFVDATARRIILWFQGPAPQICTKEYNPVSGVEGSFGPLSPGSWEFIGIHPRASFTISFLVGPQATPGIHVDRDAPGPHDGTTWTRAFRHLTDGLAAAGSGATVKVAEGTYYPDTGSGVSADDPGTSFVLKDGVTVTGGYAGYGQPDPDARDPRSHPTILSGDLQQNDLWGLLNTDDNAYHVVSARHITQTAVLEGCILQDGQADGPYPDIYGGGLLAEDADLLVVDCVLRSNRAAYGGGLASVGGKVRLVNVDCSGNRAWGFGGGVYVLDGGLDLANALITGNTSGFEAAGGAALYSVNGDVTLVNCSVADNPSASAAAVAGFGWGSPGQTLQVLNSILYNGGNEIWTNQPAQTDVRYSDIQGGHSGPGNLSGNPRFVQSGQFGIEGQWVPGNYRLKATSPAINRGLNSLLPVDSADLDRDGDTAEALPLDLDLEARVLEGRVDMGAYEQLASSGGGGGGGSAFTIWVSGMPVQMTPDPNAPDPSNTYIGCTPVEVSLNFKAKLTVEVIPTSAAGGTWTGTLSPDVVGPGTVTVTLCLKVTDIDTTKLPPGSQSVAQVSIFAVPAP